MARAVCVFDPSPTGLRSVRAAIAYARENDAALHLVALPAGRPSDPPGPAAQRSVARRNVAAAEAVRHVRTAESFGIACSAGWACGDAERSGVDLAVRTGADVVFIGVSAGPIARFLRRPSKVRTIAVRGPRACLPQIRELR